MKSLVTIGEVSNRVDALNQNCFDKLVDVREISFASLDRMRIGGDEHTLRIYRPEINLLAIGNSL